MAMGGPFRFHMRGRIGLSDGGGRSVCSESCEHHLGVVKKKKKKKREREKEEPNKESKRKRKKEEE